jgi:zinc protease
MRYVIRQNATPAGTAVVRLEIGSGSLSETDAERGYAHFVEHMAFNGSTSVPEGEMVKLLERNGLAFGADTNASTGFEQTLYKLDLPRNDPALLDTALMLMRETASELTMSPEAVERERGVVLSEMRDRNTYDLRNYVARSQFLTPGAHYTSRLPIGTAEAINAATSQSLKAFWSREYVPANAAVVVIGDFDPALVEQAIQRHFASWKPAPLPTEPDPGPVDPASKGRTDIYIDPALSERITIARNGPWLGVPDSIAERRRNLLREIGYAIVNRRLERVSRGDNPPFRSAGFGTGDVFKVGRTTRLIVDTGEGEWRSGLLAATREYRRALAFGFTPAELAEQVSNIRAASRNAAASAATRSNNALFNAVLELLRDEIVPSTPQSSLERLEAFIPAITPDAVMGAMKKNAVLLDDPLIRFEGRLAPNGGAEALRAAWNEASGQKLEAEAEQQTRLFAYTDFGKPGTVAFDQRESRLGIRLVTFANGVRLNLKSTRLQADRVRVSVSVDGGQMLNTAKSPLATAMTATLPVGGLGKHTADELESILAGRSVGFDIDDEGDAFVMDAATTTDDLELQLQLLAAGLTDPGYRPQGESQYRRNIANFFASKDATPQSVLANALGGILSDGDPRFTLQPLEDYRALSFEKLRQSIGDRLQHGAVEIALVGDFDEDHAIALVAKTFGALAPREPAFRPYDAERLRAFTAKRGQRVIRHKGVADQALLRLSWPTRDDSDQTETLQLGLLEKVVRIELLDSLREALGKAYSPSASSNVSRVYKGYGTFDIAVSVNVTDVGQTREVIAQTIRSLAEAPVSNDILQRARQPMLESYDNALKTNEGWMGLVDRAQSEAFRIDRYLTARDKLAAITASDLQALVRRYLTPAGAVEALVLPEGVEAR